jgi:putative addiction module component (TIGR02574 family)
MDTEAKLALIARIWSTIDGDALPVPPEVEAELNRRWEHHLANPGSTLSMDELMARVEAKRR